MHVSTKKIVCGLLFRVIGSGLTVKGVNDMRKAKASNSWPTAPAKITKSTVDVQRKTGDRKKKMYSAKISFDYTVEGIKHSSSKIGVGGIVKSSNKSRAQKTVDKYKVGSTAKAFYDPNDPSMAILESGISYGNVIVTIIGLLCPILGLLVIVFGQEARRTG